MIGYARAPAAFGRTKAMARMAGIDLTAAVVEGWLTRSELEALISCCASCGRSGDCAPFIATALPGALLPAYCANKPDLDALRGD
jgi:hypothetical protein